MKRRFRTLIGGATVACALLLAAIYSAHAQTSFDHFKTGYPLTGSHRTAPCESCHVSGRFKATPTQCSACHNGAMTTGQSVNHPKTTSRCDGCHQTTLWTDIRAIDHTQAKAACATCHDGKIAVGKSPKHFATTLPCESCHRTTASFRTRARMDHTGITGSCASCHNNTNAVGMTTPPHIPSGATQCNSCHNNTAASFATYTMNHGAVGGTRCDACHNGAYTGQGTTGALGTASFPGHGPTNGLDCQTCHAKAATSFTSWSGGLYLHNPSDTNCVNCHNGKMATGMTTPPHIPTATVQCSNCHTNTAANFTTYTMTHAAVTGMRCHSCHNGNYTTEGTKGATGTASFPNHVATGGRDCNTCHTSAATTFASWSGGAFTHQSTDTICSSCHNGKTATGLATPPHVPVGTVECSNCHSNTAKNFTTYSMTHAAVSASRCDSCHNGAYAGQGIKGALGTASYAGHVAANGMDCVACHATAATTFSSWAGGQYVHQAGDTNCSNCHNSKTAQGMSTPPHIPSGAVQCSNCHSNTATSFTAYTMNHAAVAAARCDSCHNGSFTAEGTKGAYGTASYAGHVATGGKDCITCHAKAAGSGYTSWAGAKYVHATTDTNCSSCHDGKTATGNPTPPHIPVTGVQCSNCHTNTATSFTTYTMSHAAVTAARCDSCHNGSFTSEGTKGAFGTASYAGHVATGGKDCATCHAKAATGGYTSWAGGAYVHAATDTNCSGCHNGKTATGNTTPPHIPVTGVQCSNCHSNTATSFTAYTMSHAAVTASRCDSCHNGSYTSEGTKGAQGTASFAGHVATGGKDCATCHAKAASGGYVTWAGGTFTHATTDTNCSSCHNGTTATGFTTPPHIPVTGVQCSSCHSNTATSFTAYTMSHAAVTAARCDSCHNGSFTSEGTKGAYGTASYAGHVATGGKDCATCHAKAASGGYVSWAGGTFTHAATDTNCASCHNGSTAKGLTTPPHIPVTGIQCSNCHSSTAISFTTYTMNHAVVTTARCDSCHNGSYTSEGTKGAYGTASFAGHVATGGKDCSTCHAKAASGGYVSWANGTFAHAATDTNCSSCHNGTTATGIKTPPHIPVTGVQCSNCHSNTATSFTTYTMNHAAVATARCDSCHNGSYTSEGTKGAQGTASFAGHVATGGKDCVTCHTKAATGSYVSWANGTFSHATTDTNCSSCHNGTTATGMTTPPHIPVTGVQCSNCHSNTAASFTAYTMSHTAVTAARCDSCHSGSYTSQGTKGAYGTASFAGHVATNGADCTTCHAKAVSGGYASWAGATYVHSASDTNCSNCHNGATATGMTTPPHIPVTGVQCSNCHKNTATSFTTYTMSHAAVHATRCDSCHNGSYRSQGTKGAQGPDHSAKPQDCGCCHVKSTTTFTSWDNPQKPAAGCVTTAKTLVPATKPTTMAVVRSAVQSVVTRTIDAVTTTVRSVTGESRGDSKPPSTSTAAHPPAPTPPAPPNQPAPVATPTPSHGPAANVLFSNKPLSTSTFSPSGSAPTAQPMLPASPGNSGLARIAPTAPAGAPKPGASVSTPAATPTGPTALSTAQNSGLAGTATRSAPPAAIGSPTGQPTLLPPIAPFRDLRPGLSATGPSPGLARFNHATAPGRCASCHDGLKAAGKPPRHIATNAPCETCHRSTATFAGARFSHSGTTAACTTCHNGTTAIGKPARHVMTKASCETCHKSTVTFAGARFSHSGTTAACATCHNGTTAVGKPVRHVMTNAPCETCHKSTATFAGARFDHSATAAACASCHNGSSATGKGPKHFMTNLPCDTCHRTVSWTAATYRHMSAAYPNHGAAIACSRCHSTNSQVVAWKFAAYKPDCAGCHAAEFRPQQHVKSLKPVPMNYTVAELKDCTGACHVYADRSLTTIQTRRQRVHRVNGGGW